MAKPKLALIPAAQGDKFYSVLPSDGVGDFTFSRASTGTRIAPTGLIEEVPSGDSRLNYDLLNGKVVNCPHYLLEPARTNLVPYSEDFSQWTLSNATVSLNQIISPDGSLNADKLIPNATSSVNKFVVTVPTTSNGIDYNLNVFAKEGEYNMLRLEDGNNSQGAWFDLSNGTLGTVGASVTAKIQNYGNGWYRCSVTKPSVSTSVFFIIAASNTESIQVGDGTSGVYIYGASLEQGSYPTSYIPTNGTAITRAAETANGSGDAATFNDSEGVLMAEISALTENSGDSRRITISDGSTNNRVSFELDETEGLIKLFFSGSGTLNQLSTTTDVSTNFKILASYQSSSLKLYLNGFKLSQDLSVVLPIGLNDLSFNSGTGGNPFYGKTREVQYFDSALTDAQLETLTSWTSLQEMITSQLYTNY